MSFLGDRVVDVVLEHIVARVAQNGAAVGAFWADEAVVAVPFGRLVARWAEFGVVYEGRRRRRPIATWKSSLGMARLMARARRNSEPLGVATDVRRQIRLHSTSERKWIVVLGDSKKSDARRDNEI